MEAPKTPAPAKARETNGWSLFLQAHLPAGHHTPTRLNAAMEDAGGLSSNQYGFRKGKSTLDAIERVTNIALKPSLVPDRRVGRRSIV